jgi:hypothetical protein
MSTSISQFVPTVPEDGEEPEADDVEDNDSEDDSVDAEEADGSEDEEENCCNSCRKTPTIILLSVLAAGVIGGSLAIAGVCSTTSEDDPNKVRIEGKNQDRESRYY